MKKKRELKFTTFFCYFVSTHNRTIISPFNVFCVLFFVYFFFFLRPLGKYLWTRVRDSSAWDAWEYNKRLTRFVGNKNILK